MQLSEVLALLHHGMGGGLAFLISSPTRISGNGMDLKYFQSLSF